MNHPVAVAGFARSVFEPMGGRMREIPIGLPIRDVPAYLGERLEGAVICRSTGREPYSWIDRASWDSIVMPGDVLEFYRVPADNDTLRSVLLIAAVFVPQLFGLQGAALFAATVAGQIAVNALLPPAGPQAFRQPGQTGEASTTSLQGNAAALDQPVPRICGQKEINPRFACEPYLEFLPRPDAEDPELDQDQYFYAIFAIGVGDYEVFPKIGNTPLSRFDDVVAAEYLAPGEAPSFVEPNVSTADEVASQTLESGRYSGGFAACNGGRTVAAVGIDIAAPRGLGKGADPLTVTWRVEWRPINDFGQILGPWQVLATETRTAYTATPQRWSNRYDIPEPARVEIRVVRTDIQDTDATALHELSWIGLRAYLQDPAPLNPNVAHFEIVLRATGQLSQGASRDFRLIVKGKCRGLDESLAWTAEAFTRNPALWALDLATSDVWGAGKPDARIDLQSFRDLAVRCDARQDRFDYCFDSTVSAWDALQLIARAARARVFRRNGVLTIARDEWIEIPTTAFSPRNCQPGSIRVTERLWQRTSPDGVVLEYLDHRTNEWTEIREPLPGIDESDVVNPVYLPRLEGVIGQTHARREARYEAARIAYRSRNFEWVTEMHGLLPAFMDPVFVQPGISGYGSTGDVVDWDAATNVLTLTEAPDFDAGDLSIWLFRNDGTLQGPIAITPGPTSFDVTLAEPPDFALNLEEGDVERPRFILGTLDNAREVVRVTGIADGGLTEATDTDPGGAQLFALTGVNDDERIHTADNDLLPSPGEEQDPLGLPDDSDETGGGETLIVIRILEAGLEATTSSTVDTNDLAVAVEFDNTGRLRFIVEAGGSITSAYQTGQWSLYGQIETSKAELYEIRATLIYSYDWPDSDNALTGTFDAWQSLGTTRTWELRNQYVSPSDARQAIRQIRFEIRETSTGIVQDSKILDLRTFFDAGLGGGGA